MADQAVGLLSPWLRRARIRAALPHLRGRVLDYGAGVGALAAHIPPARYVGFDTDVASVQMAAREYPAHVFATTIPCGPFDTVAALALLEHLDDQGGFLLRAAGLLADGGRIVLTTPHARTEVPHAIGAQLGLFSRSAAAEHTHLLDRPRLYALAEAAGLRVAHFVPFLFGFNQLLVLERAE